MLEFNPDSEAVRFHFTLRPSGRRVAEALRDALPEGFARVLDHRSRGQVDRADALKVSVRRYAPAILAAS